MNFLCWMGCDEERGKKGVFGMARNRANNPGPWFWFQRSVSSPHAARHSRSLCHTPTEACQRQAAPHSAHARTLKVPDQPADQPSQCRRTHSFTTYK